MKMYRQGDILLIERDENPLIQLANTNILKEGTLTGHHHKVKNGKIFFQPIDDKQVFAYVMAEDNCELYHDEHRTIKLPIGVYEVRRQREVNGYVRD